MYLSPCFRKVSANAILLEQLCNNYVTDILNGLLSLQRLIPYSIYPSE